MSGQSAVSARVLVRGFTTLAGVFVLFLGLSCGRENFDLLDPGQAGMAGASQSNSGATSSGATSGRSGSGGGDRDAGATSTGGTGGTGDTGGTGGTSGTGGGNPVDGGPSCLPTAASCKHCQGQSDCHGTFTPICDLASHLCVACHADNDCGTGTCDKFFFRCEKKCQGMNDCDASHVCSGNECVECQQDKDCPTMHGHPPPACVAEFCVECSDDTRCPPAKPSCQAFNCVALP